MKIKVVLTRSTVDMLWGISDPNSELVENQIPLGPDDVIVEIDESVISKTIDLFGGDNLDDYIRQLAHLKLSEES